MFKFLIILILFYFLFKVLFKGAFFYVSNKTKSDLGKKESQRKMRKNGMDIQYHSAQKPKVDPDEGEFIDYEEVK